jgi:hypothetical protein
MAVLVYRVDWQVEWEADRDVIDVPGPVTDTTDVTSASPTLARTQANPIPPPAPTQEEHDGG